VPLVGSRFRFPQLKDSSYRYPAACYEKGEICSFAGFLIDMQNTQFPWYVIQVRINSERMLSATLRDKGYETYLPVYRTRRKWADRIKELEVPLFPGYSFCRLDAQNRLPVLQSPGVISILGSGSGPTAIDDTEIEAIQRMLSADLPVGPWPFLRNGQTVVVERGPLAGLTGYVVEIKTRYRLVVSLSLLNRSVSAEVQRDWIRPIESSEAAGKVLSAIN